jgi:hypothetical protein
VTFPYILILYLDYVHPLLPFSIISFLLRLKDFHTFHWFVFIKVNKLHRPYSPSFPLYIHSHCPATSIYLLSGLVLHSFIFKCIFIVQRTFTTVFCAWSHCTLIRLPPPLTLFLPPHYSITYSAFYYTISIHSCNVFQYYSLFCSPTPPVPTNSPSITNMFYNMHIFIYENVCVYWCVCILCLASTHERKHETFVLLNLAYFT